MEEELEELSDVGSNIDLSSNAADITCRPKYPYNFITIGEMPKIRESEFDFSKYDIYLNVAFEVNYLENTLKKIKELGAEYYKVPIIEENFWGYKSLFQIKKIMDQAFDDKKKVYLHCMNGAFRSRTNAGLWIYSHIGNLKEAFEYISDDPSREIKLIKYYQNENVIPKELNKFYDRYKKYGPNYKKIISTEPGINVDIKSKRQLFYEKSNR